MSLVILVTLSFQRICHTERMRSISFKLIRYFATLNMTKSSVQRPCCHTERSEVSKGQNALSSSKTDLKKTCFIASHHTFSKNSAIIVRSMPPKFTPTLPLCAPTTRPMPKILCFTKSPFLKGSFARI